MADTADMLPETAPMAVDDAAAAPFACELRIADDKLSVRLDCSDPHRDLEAVVSRIIAGFRELELPEYPDAAFVAEILTNTCAPGADMHDVPLIMGLAPVPTRHGRLEWSREYFLTGWAVDDETDSIDFWDRVDNRSVVAGERLLVVQPAIAGEPGLNVFGNKIPVENPQRARMRCGKGVTEAESDRGLKIFTAQINGRIRVSDGTVAVDEVYVIKGDVDMDNGNVSHTGSLQIDGDIKTGARIDVRGDVVVRGMVEPCHMTCGGSLIVNGGIVGEEGYRLDVGGDMQARYIRDACALVEGDVNVANEITHSDVRTRGRVQVPRGRIAGGNTIARKGITVAEAGASGADDTVLVAGVDPTLEERLRRVRRKIVKMDKLRTRIRKVILAARNNQDTDQRVSAGHERKAQNLGRAIADAECEIRHMTDAAADGAREEIVMTNELWSGTTLQLGDHRTVAMTTYLKPRIARRRRQKVDILPLGDGNMPDED